MAQNIDSSDTPAPGYTDSGGLRVYFQQQGAGAPMVLVHGWGSDAKHNWVDTGWVETLREIRRVITIDVRGHGASDKPYALAPYGYAAMSRDVLAVMDALNIERADFMGYSMGAFMGAHLIGHHSDRFTSMVLGGIGNETDQSAALCVAIAAALRAPDIADIKSASGRHARQFVESIPGNDLEALAFSALKMWPEGYPLELAGPGIANARLPVLVVNGADDHPYVDSADDFVAAMLMGRHVRIPGTDHLTVVSDPRFRRAVVEFLQAQIESA